MPIDRNDLITLLKRMHLFRGIDEINLSALLDYFEIVNFQPGQRVFEQGEDADKFYIIFQGRLKVSRYTAGTHHSAQVGFLEEGDYLGHEVLAEDWPRQVTIEAITDAVLLQLSVPNFKTILSLLPNLPPRLQMILDSYRLMLNTNFGWLDPEETVYFVARRHILFLFTHILPPLVLGTLTIPFFFFMSLSGGLAVTSLIMTIIATLVTLAWLIWAWVDWSNDYYIVTSRRIIYQERVILLYDSRQESPMEAVQSTSSRTTQVGRILKYGNVAIRTYIGTILFRSVSNPELVMALLQEHQARAQINMRRAEQRLMETMIKRRIFNGPPEPVITSKPVMSPVKPYKVQSFLSDMFHLRIEMDGTILYRTHWFILLKKTWLPGTLLLGLFAVWLMAAFGLFTLLSQGAVTALVMMVGTIIFGWWFYQYLDWHNDVYLITPEQVVDVNKKPLGKEERQAAPIKNILSIEYKRFGILGLFLNFGTVFIRVGDQELTFDDVFNPSEVQRELFNRLAARTHAEKQNAQEGERQRMADWVVAYHSVTERNQPPRTPPAHTGF